MKPPEDMSARVERLAPRLRAYVRGLEQKIAALENQLGDGPPEFETSPRPDPDRYWRAGERIALETASGVPWRGWVVKDEAPPDTLVMVRWENGSISFVEAEDLSDPPTTG